MTLERISESVMHWVYREASQNYRGDEQRQKVEEGRHQAEVRTISIATAPPPHRLRPITH